MNQQSYVQQQDAGIAQSSKTALGVGRPINSSRYRDERRRRSQFVKGLQQTGWALLYLSPALAIFLVFAYWPFFRAIWLSLHITNELGETARFVGLRYYQQILNFSSSNQYLHSLGISFLFVLLVVPLQIVSGLALGALAQSKVRGIRIFRSIFTASIAVSLASASVIWRLLYDPNTHVTTWLVDLLGLAKPSLLTNTSTALAAIAVMTVWSGLGFNFVITFAGIQAIPTELYESAALDGAGRWHKFRHITLPLLTPVLLFLLVVNTIQSFQAFTQFHVLIGGEGPEGATNVFVYAIYRIFWIDHRYGLASAMSIILFAILLLLSTLQFVFLGRKVHYQ